MNAYYVGTESSRSSSTVLDFNEYYLNILESQQLVVNSCFNKICDITYDNNNINNNNNEIIINDNSVKMNNYINDINDVELNEKVNDTIKRANELLLEQNPNLKLLYGTNEKRAKNNIKSKSISIKKKLSLKNYQYNLIKNTLLPLDISEKKKLLKSFGKINSKCEYNRKMDLVTYLDEIQRKEKELIESHNEIENIYNSNIQRMSIIARFWGYCDLDKIRNTSTKF